MSYRDLLDAQLRRDEGVKESAYQDSEGYWTIGVGHLIDARLGGKVSPTVIALMLDEDKAEAERIARALVPIFDELTDARKAAVCNMAFNLGQRRLAQFVNTLKAINERRWEDAASGMRDSLWARQVGERAHRLADAMRDGS